MPQHYDEVNGSRSRGLLLKRFSRRSALVLALAIALVTTTIATSMQAPASRAADVGDVTWNPGDVTWDILDDGRCLTTQAVNINTPSHEDAVTLSTALQGLPAKTDYPADSGIQDTHANIGISANTPDFPVVLHAYLDGNMCQDANAAQQTLYGTTGGGKLDTVQLASAPVWLQGAIGAVAGAAVYVAVSAMVTAGVTAAGVLVGASTAVVTAVTAMSGCIGGAASIAVTLQLAGGGGDWQETLSNALAGCLTGTTIALLPIKEVGEAAGNALRSSLGLTAVATVGKAGAKAAESAGVNLNGITQVISTTADTVVAVK
jgi:hypothetical protein